MPRDAREIVVFLASPSDVAEDREAVRRAARAVNDSVARPFGLRLHVEGWEEVQPGLGRPQQLINPLVDECDVFVGLLNRWWGTPTGEFTSGFEEEFDRIVGRQREPRPPVVGLFFRSLSADDVRDPGEGLKKVLDFQRRVREDHAALYKPYDSVPDLEIKAQAFFAALVSHQAAASALPPQGTGPAPASAPDPPSPRDADDHGDASRSQLAAVLSAWADLVQGANPPDVVDRDRLLTWALAVSTNRDLLPVHAANRLYVRRDALDLVWGELRLWLRTICSDFSFASVQGRGRVIPGLFHFQDIEARNAELADLAADDSDDCARGALRLLAALGARPASLWKSDANDAGDGAAARWAELLTADKTGSAAADYLFDTATPADDQLLAAVATIVGDHPAAQAVLSAARGDDGPAVGLLLSHPYSPPDWTVTATGRAIAVGLPPDRLAPIVEGRHRQDQVRAAAFDALITHPDTTPEQRQAAFAAMVRRTPAGRDHLIAAVTAEGTSAARADLRRAWDSVPKDDKVGDADRIAAAASTPDELAAAEAPGYAGVHAFNARSHQGAPGLAERARQVLRTGGREFTDDFPGLGDDEQDDKLRDFIAGRGREAAVRILAALPPDARDPDDTHLIRIEADARHWVSQNAAVMALTARAEPQDVSALLDAAANAALRPADKQNVLRAACAVGGPTVARALIDEDDSQMCAAGAEYLAAHPATDDGTLDALLHHKDAAVRRPAIDAVLARNDQDQLARLLDDYPRASGGYFYDVIAAVDWHLYAHPIA